MSKVRRTMGIIVVWAWMLWELGATDHGCYCGFRTAALESDAVDNRRYCGLGMHALGIERSRPGRYSSSDMDALGNRMLPTMGVIMDPAWVFCALDHERYYYGLGPRALGPGRSRPGTLLSFGHVCSGNWAAFFRCVRAMMEVLLQECSRRLLPAGRSFA